MNWVIEVVGNVAIGSSVVATASQTLAGTSELSVEVPVTGHLPVAIALSSARENVGMLQATVSRGGQPIGDRLTVSLSSSHPGLAQVPSEVEIPAGQTVVDFGIKVVNDSIWASNQTVLITARNGNIVSGAGSVVIIDDDSPWHNFANAVDVNGNNAISPLDALLVINLLNISRGKSVYELAQPNDGSKLFADTNNDEAISPLDALLVINQLNNRGRGGSEGEADEIGLAERETWPTTATYVDLGMQDFEFRRRRK